MAAPGSSSQSKMRVSLTLRAVSISRAAICRQPFGFAVDEHDGAGAVRHQHAVRARLDGKTKQFLGELVRRAIAFHCSYADSRSHGRSKCAKCRTRQSCRCNGKYVLRLRARELKFA